MTIEELNKQLNNSNYSIKVNPKNIYVYNKQKEHVASISRTQENDFKVMQFIPMQLMCATVIHFANTPLRERIADVNTDLTLTKDDLETFQKMDLFQQPNLHDIEMTQDERKVLFKIIQQYKDQYPHGIKAPKDNPLIANNNDRTIEQSF